MKGDAEIKKIKPPAPVKKGKKKKGKKHEPTVKDYMRGM